MSVEIGSGYDMIHSSPPIGKMSLLAPEGLLVFGLSAAGGNGIILGALISGIFTLINGIILLYLPRRWAKNDEHAKERMEENRGMEGSVSYGGGSGSERHTPDRSPRPGTRSLGRRKEDPPGRRKG